MHEKEVRIGAGSGQRGIDRVQGQTLKVVNTTLSLLLFLLL